MFKKLTLFFIIPLAALGLVSCGKGDQNIPPRLVKIFVVGQSNDAKESGTSKSKGELSFDASGKVIEGANLVMNEYGPPAFADFFFFITGFHGTHVFSGVVLNVLAFYNTANGVYEKRGHYDMIEKIGLYWHFVDLVWVFVFTFFYLV